MHEQALRRASTLLARTEPARSTGTRRLTVAADGGAAQLVDVVRRLGEERIKVDDVGLRRPTCDDVFLALTGRRGRSPPRTRRWQRSLVTAAVGDGLVMTWRNLKRVPRIPELAIFAILQSIMFVLLF